LIGLNWNVHAQSQSDAFDSLKAVLASNRDGYGAEKSKSFVDSYLSLDFNQKLAIRDDYKSKYASSHEVLETNPEHFFVTPNNMTIMS
jgi:hypothetical protein